MYAFAPNGSRILGTLDVVQVRAEIVESSFAKAEDGSLTFEHAGESEVFWDSQETVVREGKALYLSADGEEWTEDQITLHDSIEAPERDDSSVFARDMLSEESRVHFAKPWVFQTAAGTTEYDTEDEACAAQRAWRKSEGFDEMTGERP